MVEFSIGEYFVLSWVVCICDCYLFLFLFVWNGVCYWWVWFVFCVIWYFFKFVVWVDDCGVLLYVFRCVWCGLGGLLYYCNYWCSCVLYIKEWVWLRKNWLNLKGWCLKYYLIIVFVCSWKMVWKFGFMYWVRCRSIVFVFLWVIVWSWRCCCMIWWRVVLIIGISKNGCVVKMFILWVFWRIVCLFDLWFFYYCCVSSVKFCWFVCNIWYYVVWLLMGGI